METADNNTQTGLQKFHPGSKGTDIMNTRTPEELKDLRKEIIESTRSMIGRGYTYKMKMDTLATQYGVSTRQAKKYIQYTRQDITKRKQEEYDREYDDVLIKLDTLYRELFATNKLDQALKVLNQLIMLRGYEAPKAIMVKSQVDIRTDLSHLTEDQLLQLTTLLNPGTVVID